MQGCPYVRSRRGLHRTAFCFVSAMCVPPQCGTPLKNIVACFGQSTQRGMAPFFLLPIGRLHGVIAVVQRKVPWFGLVS